MATTAYTPESGEPGIWLRFPKTEPTYENCFGKEYFRFFLYSCSTEVTGWSIIRNLELTALDLATICHELLSEQRQKWQTQRPSGSPYHAEWSLKCLLMGPRRSQASPHVVIFTTDASLGEKIIDIIRKSGLFKDFPGWTCISLWSSIIDRTTVSNLFNSPFFSLTPLTQSQRHIYLDMLWPKTSSYTLIDDARVTEQDAYFDYIDQERNPAAAQDHVFAKFDDFFFIVSVLKGYWSQSLEQVVHAIRDQRPGLAIAPSKLSFSIELAVRLWLLMDTRIRMPYNPYQLQTAIPWHDRSSLSLVQKTYITPHRRIWDGVIARFPEHFNLDDIRRISGIRVEWTNNLTLHLTMKGRVVYIFHGVSILQWIHESVSSFPLTTARASSPFFKLEFIEETIATIALLIPCTNDRCNSWLANEVQRLGLDKNIIHREAATMDKSRYPYWQDKLLAIEDAFEKSRPRTLAQWWYDTRDTQRWWGFWLAVTSIFLTVLFGLLQSITAIMQVVKPS
ncbi:hypothetical protein F5Y08DRAFT_124694 [Xylaria arbuscula]|nr:hypothetical protein F5Y08DRAFT_124694 [Xylaria arbuscula]